MDAHLGYEHGDRAGKDVAGQANSRNGSYSTTVDSAYGLVDISVPRDRAGTYMPRMVPKGSRRLTDLDDMIISLYAGGMTVRDIEHYLAPTMGVNLSPDTISGKAVSKHLQAVYTAVNEDAARAALDEF